MARQRYIKPEFWWDEAVDELDNDCALGLIALYNIVDDEGRFRFSEREVELSCPRTNLRGRWGHILSTLEAGNFIITYEVAGKKYFHIRTWHRHQPINRPTPSHIPSPPKGDPIKEQVKAQRSTAVRLDEGIPYNDIYFLWNRVCGRHLANVTFDPKDDTLVVIRSAWLSYEERRHLAWWKQYFQRIARSDFLTGKINNFAAPFRWVFLPDNVKKVMSGQYDNHKDGRKQKALDRFKGGSK